MLNYLSYMWFDIYDMYIFELKRFFAIFQEFVFRKKWKFSFLLFVFVKIKIAQFSIFAKICSSEKSYELKNIHVINI